MKIRVRCTHSEKIGTALRFGQLSGADLWRFKFAQTCFHHLYSLFVTPAQAAPSLRRPLAIAFHQGWAVSHSLLNTIIAGTIDNPECQKKWEPVVLRKCLALLSSWAWRKQNVLSVTLFWIGRQVLSRLKKDWIWIMRGRKGRCGVPGPRPVSYIPS